jgi:hypothetical protein
MKLPKQSNDTKFSKNILTISVFSTTGKLFSKQSKATLKKEACLALSHFARVSCPAK